MDRYNLVKVVKIVSVCATCLLVVLVGVIIGQYVKLGSLKRQEQSLQGELASIESRRTALEAGIDVRTSAGYLERQAREELGMIEKGETLYVYR